MNTRRRLALLLLLAAVMLPITPLPMTAPIFYPQATHAPATFHPRHDVPDAPGPAYTGWVDIHNTPEPLGGWFDTSWRMQ